MKATWKAYLKKRRREFNLEGEIKVPAEHSASVDIPTFDTEDPDELVADLRLERLRGLEPEPVGNASVFLSIKPYRLRHKRVLVRYPDGTSEAVPIENHRN